MAESILSDIAVEVLKKLASTASEELHSAWGYKTEVKKLRNTMDALKDVLLDAEERQADNHATRGWLERLAPVVYAADDLFDELNVVAARKELMGGQKFTRKVRTFFSHSNQVAFACKVSQNIKKIREELDAIVKDGTQFQFVRGSPERGSAMMRRDQTMSYVDESGVVGRDVDKNAILDMLLASSSIGNEHGLDDEEVPVISIVGMGGMGKTTLAQLIYNDPHVKKSFDLRLWVCVSDVFDLKTIIEQLLKSATNNEAPNLDMDQLEDRLQKELTGKTYLLVLDDVWNEDRNKWVTLRDLLKIGRKGSKILVTTRSREVSNIMGISTHVLKGLSEEKSWELFEKMAFKSGEAQEKPHLVEMGKEIVKKCGHVPLAIRTLGSLLYGQEERRWLSVKEKSLNNQSDIMDILRLSYHNLWSPLKNCFAYSAIFPKDYVFRKEMLMDLWIAEGFIVVPSNDDHNVDNVAEEYFHTLLQRGFFQDIVQDDLGVIKSCKMHDLMHDLTQNVAGVNCKVANCNERSISEKCIHVSLADQLTSSQEIPKFMLNMKLLRTFLVLEQVQKWFPSKSYSLQLVMQCRSLRVLDLNGYGLKSLPSSIGELIHLRYLDLSRTSIEKLPDSSTNLWNLQTLKLYLCSELIVLPSNMRKLTNLRCVDVSGCRDLHHMPSGLGELTSMSKLPRLIVGHKNRDAANSRHKPSAKLSDLKNLNNLRGLLDIEIRGNIEDSMLSEAQLSSKHGLTELDIRFARVSCDDCGAGGCKHDENVLEGLKPPSGIRRLGIRDYRGQKLPTWAEMDNLCTTLPSLVDITLWRWRRCQQVPTFSQLPSLKRLSLRSTKSVEYMESGVPSSSSTSFFPSLGILELHGMKNVKGWWKSEEEEEGEASVGGSDTQQFPTRFMQFPKLSELRVIDCPNLRMLPVCPNVEDVSLQGTNERLSVIKMAATTSSSSSSVGGSGLKLKRLGTGNIEELMSLPHHCLLQLSSLRIHGDDKLEGTERLGQVLATQSSSLRSLTFSWCHNLRSIAKGLEHLTALEDLEFKWCDELDLIGDDEEEEEGMPWKAFNTGLRSLRLEGLPKLVGLPRGLQHMANLRSLRLSSLRELEKLPEWIHCLSSLEELSLSECPKLTSLPESFSNLTSLRQLWITACGGLSESCRGPDGRDYPKIRHISTVTRDGVRVVINQ